MTFAFLTHDQRGLGVDLQAQQAVDDVYAFALQRSRPLDVALLVEARLELDQRGDLLAVFDRFQQGLHHRAHSGPRGRA